MPAGKPSRAPQRGHPVVRARNRAGLTQLQLAERIGVSRPTIERIEAGGHAPSVEVALMIARELRKPVETLFEGDPTVIAKTAERGVGNFEHSYLDALREELARAPEDRQEEIKAEIARVEATLKPDPPL